MSFLLALAASFITYIYMQWPIIIGMIIPAALIMLVIAIMMLLVYLSNDTEQARNKERQRILANDPNADVVAGINEWNAKLQQVQKRANRYIIIAVSLFALNSLVPNQKVLGTVVAVGATTYFAHEVVSSDVVQTFLDMVKGEAMGFMKERMDATKNATAQVVADVASAAVKSTK